MPPQRKPVHRKALSAPAQPSRSSKRSRAPTTIADLSADVLLRTLALTGHPARYASVCTRWNDLLADSSEVWKECVLTSTQKPIYNPHQPVEATEDTGAMLKWLMRRCMSMESITFRQFKLLMLTNCTSLHLHDIASGPDPCLQLGDLCQALPQLRNISAAYSSSYGPHAALPSSLAACGRLRRCRLVDLKDGMHTLELPDSISGMSSLATLSMYGIYLSKISGSIGQLTALRSLRMLVSSTRTHSLDPLRLPPETAQLAMSLQRLSFCSKGVPLELTALQSLTRLSIGCLVYADEVGSRIAGLSVLTSIANLRFHRCFDLKSTWPGLLMLLNALPKLKALALDRNGMTSTSLGNAAKRLTSLNLKGSAYDKSGLPTSLRRAVNCQKLQLTVQSWDALTQGGTQPLAACPLLSMHSLQTLVLQQPVWYHPDVMGLLALQRCFYESNVFRGMGPTVICPTDPERDMQYQVRGTMAESSDDEDDI